MMNTATDWACGIGAVSTRRPFSRVWRSNTLIRRAPSSRRRGRIDGIGALDSPVTGGPILDAMELETRQLLSIGMFAQLSGLTVKALRHYDQIDLLKPAHVDESSGYRYYALAQARTAEAIRTLRAPEVPLDEVRS